MAYNLSMKIIFYTKTNEEIPVQDFLRSLDPKLRRKTTEKLLYLQEKGFQLKEPDVKKLHLNYKQGELPIWELRTKLGTNITRIFYFFWDGDSIVLTNGFIKKSMKTPPNEIQKARLYQKDYQLQKKKE